MYNEAREGLSLLDLPGAAILAAHDMDEFFLDRLEGSQNVSRMHVVLERWMSEADVTGISILSHAFRELKGYSHLRTVEELKVVTGALVDELSVWGRDQVLAKDRAAFFRSFFIALSRAASAFVFSTR
jgi:hypothetical protein